MAKLVIDMTGRGGLAKKWGGDINLIGIPGSQQVGQPNLRYNAKDNQMVNGVYNPITKYGYLSPSPNTYISFPLDTDEDDEISVRLIDDREKNIYLVDSEALYRIPTYGFDEASLAFDFTTSTGQATDMCIYYLNGVRTGFIMVRSSASTRIKTFNLSGSLTVNEDWSSSDVSGAFALPQSYAGKLIPSGDGFMYVLNKNSVHRVDGTVIGGSEGTIYRDILQAPSDANLTHGVEYKNKLYIAVQTGDDSDWRPSTTGQGINTTASPEGQVGIYVWNRQSTFYNSSDFIDLPGVSYICNMWVSPKNNLYVMAILPTGECNVMVYDGTKFVTTQQLPPGAQTNEDDALCVHGNFTYWAGADGFIYMFGSEFPDEPEGIVKLLQYNTGGFHDVNPVVLVMRNWGGGDLNLASTEKERLDIISVIGEFEDNTIEVRHIAPYAINTISREVGLSTVVTNIEQHKGDIYTPVKFLPTLSTVKNVVITMAPVTGISGDQKEAAIKFYFNQLPTASFTKYVTRADIAKGYVNFEINKPYVNSIQMEIEYFNSSNLNPEGLYSNIGVADFCPAYAEITYEPTSTLR